MSTELLETCRGFN